LPLQHHWGYNAARFCIRKSSLNNRPVAGSPVAGTIEETSNVHY